MSSCADDPLRRLVAFTGELRRAGVRTGGSSAADFAAAAALLPPQDLYWAGRQTLISRPEDLPIYDRLFAAEFAPESGVPERPDLDLDEPQDAVGEPSAGETEPEDAGVGADETVVIALASELEELREKSFKALSDAELLALRDAGRGILAATRRTRRWQPAGSGTPDMRRTLRRAARAGGEPWDLRSRARRTERRRVVLLLDVSGSMAAYSRALLVLAHAALQEGHRWEVFCFATRLTRVTPALRHPGLWQALDAVAAEVADWDGGTLIGEAVEGLIRDHGRGAMLRGAHVIVCSDGLERGDPEVLERGIARLSRLSHRVVWLNPLYADPAYQPLARGMRAALPHVDLLLSGHNLASIEEAGRALAGASSPSEHDPRLALLRITPAPWT